ncbi:MAG TPA: thioesterase, partial [Micrococcus luteus]|nr:thioesterase [Micrococcus luteus]
MSEHTATTPAASDRVYRPGVTPELSPAELAAACAEAGLTPE